MAIDDLSVLYENTFVIKYADDVSLLHFVKDPSHDSLQHEWDNLVRWSTCNKLPLNLSKCNVMDICTKKNLQLAPIQVSSGCHLKQVNSLRFLGVTLSANLKWNCHVDSIVSKVCQRLFIIRNLRRSGCPPCLILESYKAFIEPLLLYGFPSFCNVSQYLFNRLCRIERRVLKIIYCHDVHSPQVSLRGRANSLCEKLLTSIEKCCDHPLRCMFAAPSSRATRSNRSLVKPFAKTKRFSDSFIRFCK